MALHMWSILMDRCKICICTTGTVCAQSQLLIFPHSTQRLPMSPPEMLLLLNFEYSSADVSQYYHTVTPVNNPIISSSQLILDGLSYLNIPYTPDLDTFETNELTISFIMISNSYSSSAAQTIISKRELSPSNDGHYNIFVSAGRLWFGFGSSNTRVRQAGASLKDGATYNGMFCVTNNPCSFNECFFTVTWIVKWTNRDGTTPSSIALFLNGTQQCLNDGAIFTCDNYVATWKVHQVSGLPILVGKICHYVKYKQAGIV
jgi:hypothetical protein